MFGLMFTTVMGAVGFAVDYERAQEDKKIVQNHLDATLIHLGRSESKRTPQAPGTSFLMDSLKNARVEFDDISAKFTYDSETGSVKGTVEVMPRTLISKTILSNTLITVTSSATPKVEGVVEIALVLDNSGSMNFSIDSDAAVYVNPPNRRADSLQDAVAGMFDVIYSNPLVTPAVSVVPYSDTVDITDIYVDNSNSKFFGANGWTLEGLGLDDFDAEDTTFQNRFVGTGKGAWATERFLSRRFDNFYNVSLNVPSNSANHVGVLSQGEFQTWCDNSYVWRFGERCIQVAKGPDGRFHRNGYFQAKQGIQTMTTDAETVRSYVKAFEPQGSTAGHLGAAWGIYTLLPEWGTFFDHPAGTPAPLSDDKSKYLVVMTDGEFNSGQRSDMYGVRIFYYFLSMCQKARENGIKIFTVGLKVDKNTNTDISLRACSGSTGHHFPVEDHDSLAKAFVNIGRQTSTGLRISS